MTPDELNERSAEIARQAESEHTPEPWLVEYDGESARIYSEDYGGICYLHHDSTVTAQDGISHADAARIVACMNYCAGLSPAQLEGTALETIGSLEIELGDLEAKLAEIDSGAGECTA